MSTKSLSREAAAVLQVRRQLGITQSALARLIGVHPMTVSRWERDDLRLVGWHRSLIGALLMAQPRANLQERLTEDTSSPVMILGHLLSDAINSTGQRGIPSPSPAAPLPLAPRPPLPPPRRGQNTPLALPPRAAPPPPPTANIPAVPEITRFSLLDLDD